MVELKYTVVLYKCTPPNESFMACVCVHLEGVYLGTLNLCSQLLPVPLLKKHFTMLESTQLRLNNGNVWACDVSSN